MALKGKRILVVDDNLINLDIASETLLTSGALVDSAASGEEALTYLAKAQYDLVLLDLTMPGIDGMTVGRSIRASENNGKAAVLVFTASDAGDAKAAVKELNAQGVIYKPVDVDDLLNTVGKHA
jgi:CheY-like chemotaxis protein